MALPFAKAEFRQVKDLHHFSRVMSLRFLNPHDRADLAHFTCLQDDYSNVFWPGVHEGIAAYFDRYGPSTLQHQQGRGLQGCGMGTLQRGCMVAESSE